MTKWIQIYDNGGLAVIDDQAPHATIITGGKIINKVPCTDGNFKKYFGKKEEVPQIKTT